jgi:hypothetical protein
MEYGWEGPRSGAERMDTGHSIIPLKITKNEKNPKARQRQLECSTMVIKMNTVKPGGVS